MLVILIQWWRVVDNDFYSCFQKIKHLIIFILWLWLLIQIHKILLEVQFWRLGKQQAALVSHLSSICPSHTSTHLPPRQTWKRFKERRSNTGNSFHLWSSYTDWTCQLGERCLREEKIVGKMINAGIIVPSFFQHKRKGTSDGGSRRQSHNK